jgi:hypothetical protein
MRALARARRASSAEEPDRGAHADRPWIRGYMAIAGVASGAAERGEAVALLTPDADGREARLGMLTAMVDAAPSPRLADLAVEIVASIPATRDRQMVELIARASATVGATALVPRLVDQLAMRDHSNAETPHGPWRGPAEGRSAVRAALAALGRPAFDHVASTLLDPKTPRHLRIHLPLTLAEFGTQEAADILLGFVQRGEDGLVRYRCLRALERMVTEHRVRLPVQEIRAAVHRELTEYFRLMALRHGLDPRTTPSALGAEGTRGIVLRVLDEKREQALGRVLRLLKLSFPSEDLRSVHAAMISRDASTRANAAEFLDALLAPRRRGRDDGSRALLRLVTEDLPADERVARAEVLDPRAIPRTPDAAIALLREDRDPMLAVLGISLAEEHVAAGGHLEPASERPAAAEGEALPSALRPAGAHGR